METVEAMILKVAPYSETTLLVTLLTGEHGVVRALAKGARRGARNVQAAFEPLAWVRAGLTLKALDKLGALYSPELREGWPYLRRDMDRLAYAALGIEALGGVAAQSPPDPFYLSEAVCYLERLEQTPGPGSLAIALLLRLLHHAGFPPQLAQPWTREDLPPMLSYHFDRGIFEESRVGDPSHAMRMPKAALAPLLDALSEAPSLDGSFTMGAKAGTQVLRWLARVWQDHLNEPLQAAKFLEKMVLRP